MKSVELTYHHEGDVWWSESNDIPGFSAAADTFKELRRLSLEGVEFASEGELLRVSEYMDNGAIVPSIDSTIRFSNMESFPLVLSRKQKTTVASKSYGELRDLRPRVLA